MIHLSALEAVVKMHYTNQHYLYLYHTYGIYGSIDIPAFTPAEAGTQFSDLGGMQGCVDLGGGYIPR